VLKTLVDILPLISEPHSDSLCCLKHLVNDPVRNALVAEVEGPQLPVLPLQWLPYQWLSFESFGLLANNRFYRSSAF
jgi:hypothetical protein